MFSWYKIWNFSEKDLPVSKIFAPQYFWKVWSIRSTAGSILLSCHLLVLHVLPIQTLKFQWERPCHFHDIRAKELLESLKSGAQVNLGFLRATASVLMFFWYNVYNFSQKDLHISKFFALKVLRKFEISEEQLYVKFRRATSSVLMFSWYNVYNFSQKDFYISKFFALKV